MHHFHLSLLFNYGIPKPLMNVLPDSRLAYWTDLCGAHLADVIYGKSRGVEFDVFLSFDDIATLFEENVIPQVMNRTVVNDGETAVLVWNGDAWAATIHPTPPPQGMKDLVGRNATFFSPSTNLDVCVAVSEETVLNYILSLVTPEMLSGVA